MIGDVQVRVEQKKAVNDLMNDTWRTRAQRQWTVWLQKRLERKALLGLP